MIKFLGIIALVYIFLNSPEFRNFLHLLKLDLHRYEPKAIWHYILSKILSCTKCTTFWVLLITHDVYLAAIGALIQIILDRCLGLEL